MPRVTIIDDSWNETKKFIRTHIHSQMEAAREEKKPSLLYAWIPRNGTRFSTNFIIKFISIWFAFWLGIVYCDSEHLDKFIGECCSYWHFHWAMKLSSCVSTIPLHEAAILHYHCAEWVYLCIERHELWWHSKWKRNRWKKTNYFYQVKTHML